MKLKKLTALFLAGAMCASALAGCGKTDNTGTTNSTDAQKVTATIKVWGNAEDQSADYGEWLQTRCNAFNEAHPEWDITFEYGTCGEDKAGDTVSQDPSASADVYFFANDQLGKLIDAKGISKLGGSTADYIKSTNSQALVDSVTVDGAIYGVPFTHNTWYMFYDKSVFTEEDIKSLDAMLEKGKVSFPLTTAWYTGSFFVANDCTLFGPNGTDNEAGFDFGGDKAVAVTEYLIDLVANANFMNDEGGSGMAALGSGVSAVFSGSWDYTNAKEALGDNLGIAALPTININGEAKQLKSFAGSKAIGVNPNSKYPEIAVALALFLGNADSQMSHYTARNIVPCNTELLAKDEIKSDELVIAQNATFDSTSILQPTVSNMSQYWTTTENFAKSIVNGEVTKANAAEKTEAFNTALNTDIVK
ncbi:MAG: extracellular solute-binding protein [Lachnospiraceae bacterium]|nr:extracellular solute-binding protein [Lachnospiraceae bacterium]